MGGIHNKKGEVEKHIEDARQKLYNMRCSAAGVLESLAFVEKELHKTTKRRNLVEIAQYYAKGAVDDRGRVRADWPRVMKDFEWIQLPKSWLDEILGVLLSIEGEKPKSRSSYGNTLLG